MKRAKFEYNETFVKLSEDLVNGALQEAMAFTATLDEVAKRIPMLEELDRAEDTEEFLARSFDLLDWLIDHGDQLRVDDLAELCDYPIASTEVLLKRVVAIATDVQTGKEGLTRMLSAVLDGFCDEYSFPSGGPLAVLKERTEFYLGQLGYFIYYQYGLHRIAEGVVTEPVFQYCMQEDMTPEEFEKYWSDLLRRYRPNLTVFEEYPELENPFWDVAGGYMSEFDLFADFLTKEDVLAILAPSADVVTLLGQVAARGGRG